MYDLLVQKFIFKLLFGASKGFKTLKVFIKPFEAPQKSAKIILMHLSEMYEAGRVEGLKTIESFNLTIQLLKQRFLVTELSDILENSIIHLSRDQLHVTRLRFNGQTYLSQYFCRDTYSH